MIVPEVKLRPLTELERAPFIEQELLDFAEQQVRDAGWDPAGALERARNELAPVLEREHSGAIADGHRLWSAHEPGCQSVGWLWVQPPLDGMPENAVFLYQITVKASCRGQGWGRAMLVALESELAREGVGELRLNVNEENRAAMRLYERAGYGPTGPGGRMRQLGKRLAPVTNSSATTSHTE